ncbi:MAG: PQQ-binding-like beta-propeller repeat protein [Thermoplasmata archaeon]
MAYNKFKGRGRHIFLFIIAFLLFALTPASSDVVVIYMSNGSVYSQLPVILNNGTIGTAQFNSIHTYANVSIHPSTYWTLTCDSKGGLAAAMWNGSTFYLPPNGTYWRSLSNSLVYTNSQGYVVGIAASYFANLIVELLSDGIVLYSHYNSVWQIASKLPYGNYTSLSYTLGSSKNASSIPYFFALESNGTVYYAKASSLSSWSIYLNGISGMFNMVSLSSNSGGNLYSLSTSGNVYSSTGNTKWIYKGNTGRGNERSIVYTPKTKGQEVVILNEYGKPVLLSLNGGKAYTPVTGDLPAGVWVGMVDNYYLNGTNYYIAMDSQGMLYVISFTRYVALTSDSDGDIFALSNTGNVYELTSGSTIWNFLGNAITSSGYNLATTGFAVGIAASYNYYSDIVVLTSNGYVFAYPYAAPWSLAITLNGVNFTSLTYPVGSFNNGSFNSNPSFFAMESNGTVYDIYNFFGWGAGLFLTSTNSTDMVSVVSNSGGDLMALNYSGGLYRYYESSTSTRLQYVGAVGEYGMVGISYLYGSGDRVYDILPANGGQRAFVTYNGGITSSPFGNPLPSGSYTSIVNSTSIYAAYGTFHHLAALEPNGTIYVYTRYQWSFLTGGNVVSSPSVWNGILYVGSNDGNLYALYANNGTMLWSYPTGTAIVDKPLVYNGNVYFGSNTLYALNASTGSLVWSFKFPPGQKAGNVESSPAEYGGNIYFGDDNNYVYDVNYSNGNVVWYAQTKGSVQASPTVGIVNNIAMVFIGSDDNNMYAYTALLNAPLPRGPGGLAPLWTFNSGAQIHTKALLYNGNIYFGNNNNNLYDLVASTGTQTLKPYGLGGKVYSSPVEFNGNIYIGSNAPYYYSLAVGANGYTRNWRFMPGNNIYSTAYVTPYNVYFGSDDDSLYNLNINNGLVNWTFTTYGPVRSSPLYYNNMVFFGSNDHNVYALNVTPKWEKRVTVPSLPVMPSSPVPSLKWVYNTGNAVRSSPSIAYGNVYVGSNSGYIYSLNATSGSLVWSYNTGSAIQSSPAVSNGIVYVGSNNNNLYAFNATLGTSLWTYNTGGQVFSSPDVSYGLVFVGSLSNSIYALYATSGKLAWQYNTGGKVYSSPIVVGGNVYIGSNSGYIYAFNATSTGPGPKNPIWEYNFKGAIYTRPCYYNNSIYVSVNKNGGEILALNASTGSLQWSVSINPSGVAGTEYSSPVVYEGNLYVGSVDGNLYVINISTHAILWTFGTGNAVYSTPLIYGGNAYFGSTDDTFYAVNISRESLVWSYTVSNTIVDSPSEYINLIYFGSTNNNVYAINSGYLPNAPPINDSSSGIFLNVTDLVGSSFSINLLLLNVKNISLIQYLSISINQTSTQITIINGNIVSSSGSGYPLPGHVSDYLFLNVYQSPGISNIAFVVMIRSGGVIIEELVTLNIY